MKIVLYICGIIAGGIGIYELFFWITKSPSLAIVITLLAFILAINSITLARRGK